jgi:hypothetical protein
MDLIEIGLEGVDEIHLAKDRVSWQAPVNIVMNSLLACAMLSATFQV